MSEKSRHQFLIEKYVEKKLIEQSDLNEIIKADPTSIFKIEGNKQIIKVGKYSQWVLRQYEKRVLIRLDEENIIQDMLSHDIFMEDLYKLTDDLNVYDRIKLKKDVISIDKRDINNIESTEELYDLVKEFAPTTIVITKAELKRKAISEDVDLLFDGVHWDIISPKTMLAATTVSGPPLTRWCTATEGRNAYDSYANQGPLYIMRDKKQIIPSGRGAGQPKPIWQFHFETNSYMDIEDRRVEIVDILRKDEELRQFFKPIMMKYYLKSKMVDLVYPKDNTSRFISLYGFEDFLNQLPSDITDLSIDCYRASPKVNFKLPKTISRFKKLETLYLNACVDSLPEELCELESLQHLSLPYNKTLKQIPKSFSRLKQLTTLNLTGCDSVIIPDELLQLDKEEKLWIIL
jgi:hypothetical protein